MCLSTMNNLCGWKELCAATAKHTENTLRLAGRNLTAANITALICSAPHDEKETQDADFRHCSFCRECLDLACDWMAYFGTAEDQAVYDEAERHFLAVLPCLGPQIRTLLEDSFTGVLQHPQNR